VRRSAWKSLNLLYSSNLYQDPQLKLEVGAAT
jgi:hypothetical protein